MVWFNVCMVIKKDFNGRSIDKSTSNHLYSVDSELVKFSLEYSRRQGEPEEVILKRCKMLHINYFSLK